ncbi:MAG: LamG-like jellyroll fold domain-containing protein [Verrucomicrobiota bacterium]
MKHVRYLQVWISLGALLVLLNPVNAKLVAWFPLDDGPEAGDTVAEVVTGDDGVTIGYDSDPEFSLIIRGYPSPRPNLGRATLFNKGGGLELGDEVSVQPTDKFSISFWFQPLTLDAFDRFLESQVTNTNAQDGIRIDLGTGNRVRVLIRDNNGETNTQFSHPTELKSDGTWYFFAFRYDSEGIDNLPFQLTVIELTDDPMDEATVAAATGGPGAINTGPIHTPHAVCTLIGIENPGGTGGNSLHAALDELAFYDNSDGNGVLTDQQLADVYNFGPSGVQLLQGFSAAKESVSPGNPVTLSWEVEEPFDSLILIDGEGEQTDVSGMTDGGSGRIEVSPAATTAFSLRAARGEVINVYSLTILAGAAPAIGSFVASPEVISGNGSAELSWSVTGADSVVLEPGGMDVSGMWASFTYCLSCCLVFMGLVLLS